jgi:hypothetical protein
VSYAASSFIIRRNFRRSTSDVPPQIPKVSLLLMAHDKHSGRTLHIEQIARGALLEPPRIGKKISGSATMVQRARSKNLGCETNSMSHCSTHTGQNASRPRW